MSDTVKKGFGSKCWHRQSLTGIWSSHATTLRGCPGFLLYFQWIIFKIKAEESHGGFGNHLFLPPFLIFLQREFCFETGSSLFAQCGFQESCSPGRLWTSDSPLFPSQWQGWKSVPLGQALLSILINRLVLCFPELAWPGACYIDWAGLEFMIFLPPCSEIIGTHHHDNLLNVLF